MRRLLTWREVWREYLSNRPRRRLPRYFIVAGSEEEADVLRLYLNCYIGKMKTRRLLRRKRGLPQRPDSIACDVVISTPSYAGICGNTRQRYLLGYIHQPRRERIFRRLG